MFRAAEKCVAFEKGDAALQLLVEVVTELKTATKHWFAVYLFSDSSKNRHLS